MQTEEFDVTTLSVSKQRAIRRVEQRKKAIQKLVLLLNTLPPPFGASAAGACRDLARAWHSEHPDWQPCRWEDVPPSCDPVALLDNEANQFSKKGMSLEQHIAMLNFGGAGPSAEPQQGSDVSSAEGSCPHCQPNSRLPQRLPRPLNKMSRGLQKRYQVDSFALVLRRLIDAQELQPSHHEQQQSVQGSPSHGRLHIVDFGAGTGALLLPLAHMFPQCTFTGVEMKPAAVRIMEHRVAAAQLQNVRCRVGMIETYEEPFDVALALHACGNATDYALQLAVHHRAAFLVSPCCVGKLKFSLHGGSSFSPIYKTWGKPDGALAQPAQQGSAEGATHSTACSQGGSPQQKQESIGSCPGSGNTADSSAAMDVGGCAGASKFTSSCPASGSTRNGGAAVNGSSCAGASEQASTCPGKGSTADSTAVNGGSCADTSEQASTLSGASSSSSAKPGGVGPFGLTLTHPRSATLLACLPDPVRQFELLASIADTNHSDRENPVPPMIGPEGQAVIRKKQKLKLQAQAQAYAQQQQQEQQQQQQQQQCPQEQMEQQQLVQQQEQQQQQQQQQGDSAAETCQGASALEACKGSHSTMQGDQREPASMQPSQGAGLQSDSTADAEAAADAAEDNLRCRLCKLTIELDRASAAREAGYKSGLYSMLHADKMAKHDLLVGIPTERACWAPLHAVFES